MEEKKFINAWVGETYIYRGGKVRRRDKKRIQNVVVADSVSRIEDQAFERCRLLERVQFPSSSSLYEIGNRAFFECTSLQAVKLPPSLEIIGKKTFFGCDKLKSPIFNCANPSTTTVSSTTVPSSSHPPSESSPESSSTSLKVIKDYAFFGCYSLTNITFPTALKKLGMRAFGSCINLESVEFSINIPIEEISVGCFDSCKSLKTIDILSANRLKILAKNSFSSCTLLSSIDLPNSIEVIGKGAFSFCFSLESMEMPPFTEKIGPGAFQYCALQCVQFNQAVQTIGASVFFGCTSLQAVELPPSIHAIQSRTFYGCYNMTTISFPMLTTDPMELSEDKGYYSRTSDKATIRIPNSVLGIATDAFDGCHQLSSLMDWQVIHRVCDANRVRLFLQMSDDSPIALRPYILCHRPLPKWKKSTAVLTNEQKIRHSNHIFHLLVRDGLLQRQLR